MTSERLREIYPPRSNVGETFAHVALIAVGVIWPLLLLLDGLGAL